MKLAHNVVQPGKGMSEHEELVADVEYRCPMCGYTVADAQFHMDHHICEARGGPPMPKSERLRAPLPAGDDLEEIAARVLCEFNPYTTLAPERKAEFIEKHHSIFRSQARAVLSAITPTIEARARREGYAEAREAAAICCLRGKTTTSEDQDGHVVWHHNVEMTATECAAAIRALAPKEKPSA